MKCTIMQPTYLPWTGYFNLISKVDTFVFLDDAQFQKGSWHNRNQINNNGSMQWITVPVKHERLKQKINETLFSGEIWRTKHIKMIEQTYGRHDHMSDIASILEALESDQSDNLADLNINIIKMISKKLSIKTKFLKSSDLGIDGKRSDRLAEILAHIGATEYLSPVGAKQYLEEDLFEETSEVKLTFQDFHPQPYLQKNMNIFLSHLSILDLIANVGRKDSLSYITADSKVKCSAYQSS